MEKESQLTIETYAFEKSSARQLNHRVAQGVTSPVEVSGDAIAVIKEVKQTNEMIELIRRMG